MEGHLSYQNMDPNCPSCPLPSPPRWQSGEIITLGVIWSALSLVLARCFQVYSTMQAERSQALQDMVRPSASSLTVIILVLFSPLIDFLMIGGGDVRILGTMRPCPCEPTALCPSPPAP